MGGRVGFLDLYEVAVAVLFVGGLLVVGEAGLEFAETAFSLVEAVEEHGGREEFLVSVDEKFLFPLHQ